MLIKAIKKFEFEDILNSYPEYYKEFVASFEVENVQGTNRSMGFGSLGTLGENR